MRFIFRVIIGLFALVCVVIGGWLAVQRRAPGPSMLAYTTYQGQADIVVTWPGNPARRRLAQAPTHDIRPSWSPACASLAGCRLTVSFADSAGGGDSLRQLHTVSLTRPVAANINPLATESVVSVWSPDGTHVASVQRSANQTDVYIIRASDGAAYNLSDHPLYDSQPHWSPDGTQIAFVSSRGTEIPPLNTIYIATLDDDKSLINVRQLTRSDRNEKLLGWSPDGDWLMFTAGGRFSMNQRGGLYVMRADGSETRHLTQNMARYSNPVWSPDGAWIAFEIVRSDTRSIAVLRPDGSDLRVVSDLPGVDSKPVWSPDSQWLLFESRDVDNRDVYVVRPDGSDLRNLSDHPALDVGPVWSADGQWIAFESLRTGNREVYIIQPDGSHLTNISRSRGINAQPAWSPPIEAAYRPWLLIGIAGVVGIFAVGRWTSRRFKDSDPE